MTIQKTECVWYGKAKRNFGRKKDKMKKKKHIWKKIKLRKGKIALRGNQWIKTESKWRIEKLIKLKNHRE